MSRIRKTGKPTSIFFSSYMHDTEKSKIWTENNILKIFHYFPPFALDIAVKGCLELSSEEIF